MICKETQNIIDTLLSLKHNSSGTINRIGSYEDSTAATSTTQCVNLINEIMDNYKTQNKIASSQSTTTPTTIKTGEGVPEITSYSFAEVFTTRIVIK